MTPLTRAELVQAMLNHTQIRTSGGQKFRIYKSDGEIETAYYFCMAETGRKVMLQEGEIFSIGS